MKIFLISIFTIVIGACGATKNHERTDSTDVVNEDKVAALDGGLCLSCACVDDTFYDTSDPSDDPSEDKEADGGGSGTAFFLSIGGGWIDDLIKGLKKCTGKLATPIGDLLDDVGKAILKSLKKKLGDKFSDVINSIFKVFGSDGIKCLDNDKAFDLLRNAKNAITELKALIEQHRKDLTPEELAYLKKLLDKANDQLQQTAIEWVQCLDFRLKRTWLDELKTIGIEI